MVKSVAALHHARANGNGRFGRQARFAFQHRGGGKKKGVVVISRMTLGVIAQHPRQRQEIPGILCGVCHGQESRGGQIRLQPDRGSFLAW